MKELHAISTIAYRDIMKFLRDKPRIVGTFIFPIIFIAALGGSFQANLGDQIGFNYLTFVFTGVLAQTLFQSSAAGIISLIEDRENDFSQEIFVSPISRYSIILGKIVGESGVALLQGIGIVLFGLLINIRYSWQQVLVLVPVAVVVCLFGAAFGIIVMSQIKNQRTANQIFPFLLFPQFFLAGVFNPMESGPLYLLILSRIAPMTYAVDFLRTVFYQGRPDYAAATIFTPLLNIIVMGSMFALFIIIGTYFFVKNERNR